jgi:hypothetical protein
MYIGEINDSLNQVSKARMSKAFYHYKARHIPTAVSLILGVCDVIIGKTLIFEKLQRKICPSRLNKESKSDCFRGRFARNHLRTRLSV